jgi:hypothetical protein
MNAHTGAVGEAAELFDLPADPLAFSLECHRRGWSDGLPVIPPTPERVQAMIAHSGRDPQEVVAVLPPRMGVATVEVIAVSAVMAGCEPRQFLPLLAAVAATGDPAMNLAAINATTHPVAQLILVSGPAARVAGVHGGSGCFGPGFPGNLTIGRGLRLVQLTVGGAWPGVGDRATMGSPAKIAFCTAERDDASPWPAYHTLHGLDPDAHCVTVFGAEAPANIQDHNSTSAEGILQTMSGAMGHAGSNAIVGPGRANPVLAMGPEHAATVAGDGWSREDVQRFVCEHARFPKAGLNEVFLAAIKPLYKELEDMLPIVRRPEQVHVFVTGGPGKHSMFMHPFGGKPVTVGWTPR